MHSKIIFGDSWSPKKDNIFTQALRRHKEISDRFTFDDLFRLSLRCGYTCREARDIILNNCSLSALVYQKRIENNFYLKISDDMSGDLRDPYKDVLNRKLLRDM